LGGLINGFIESSHQSTMTINHSITYQASISPNEVVKGDNTHDTANLSAPLTHMWRHHQRKRSLKNVLNLLVASEIVAGRVNTLWFVAMMRMMMMRIIAKKKQEREARLLLSCSQLA